MSAKEGGKSGGSGRKGGSGKTADHSRKATKASDIGRALRCAYDDTLREPVPDDFLNLIGKLT